MSRARRTGGAKSAARGAATRERLLDAAERLFAKHGYAGVSLREITAEAEVNVAAIHYHFKTKEELFRAIFERRLVPINQERLALLDAFEAEGLEPGDTEKVVRAFIEPYLRLTRQFGPGGTVVMQFLGQTMTDPGTHVDDVLLQHFDLIWRRFAGALQVTLPHVPAETIYWRFYFMLGALYYLSRPRQWLKPLSEGLADPSDKEAVIAALTGFLVDALEGPPAASPGKPNFGPQTRKVALRSE